MADLGTVTLSEETFSYIKKVSFAWLSDGDGKATKTTEESYTGEIIRFVTVPDGVDAPDDNYGIVILDEDGTDVLMGAGANRDTANTEQVLATSLGCVANDQLFLSVTNAGAANKGTVHLYIR